MSTPTPADLAAQRGAVALAYGLTEADAELLGDGDLDSMTANAERVDQLRAAGSPPLTTANPRSSMPTSVTDLPRGQRPLSELPTGAMPKGAVTDDDLTYAALFGRR